MFRILSPSLSSPFRATLETSGSGLNRSDNVVIASAATDVSLQTLSNLFFSRLGVILQEIGGGQNHARSAVAALETMFFPESLLQRVQLSVGCQPFDCLNR